MANSAIVIPRKWAYTPSGQKANPTALDSAILGFSPWAYWKMNETSGHFQDSSGNARHASNVGVSYEYNQAPITSKAGPSMRFDGTSAQVRFPLPQTHLGALSGTWTYMGLFLVEAELASGSPAASPYGSIFLSQAPAGALGSGYDLLVSYARTYGEALILRSSTSYIAGNQAGMQINQPLVIAIMGTSVPGAYYTISAWVNAVRAVDGCMRGGSTGAAYLLMGRPDDPPLPRLKFRASNFACWASELSPAQILDITECYMDKPSYATAYKP